MSINDPIGDFLADGSTGPNRHAQVAACQPANEGRKLLGHGSIESQVAANALDRLGTRFEPGGNHGGIAGDEMND